MSDLISRQAAINTVLNIRQKCDTNDIDEYRDILVECFEALPTAEPDHEGFLEFLFNVINPNEMEQYMAMYNSRPNCGARMGE